MHKEEIIKFVRVRFETQVSGVHKKWKINVWNLDLGKKCQIQIENKKAC